MEIFSQSGATRSISGSGAADLPGEGDVVYIMVNPVNLSGGNINPVAFVTTGAGEQHASMDGFPVAAGCSAYLRIGADHTHVAVAAQGSPVATFITRGGMGDKYCGKHGGVRAAKADAHPASVVPPTSAYATGYSGAYKAGTASKPASDLQAKPDSSVPDSQTSAGYDGFVDPATAKPNSPPAAVGRAARQSDETLAGHGLDSSSFDGKVAHADAKPNTPPPAVGRAGSQ